MIFSCIFGMFVPHMIFFKLLYDIVQGKQGIVKHIYRGIVFLYDGNEEENGGYFTCKSNMCEKVKLAVGDCSGKV